MASLNGPCTTRPEKSAVTSVEDVFTESSDPPSDQALPQQPVTSAANGAPSAGSGVQLSSDNLHQRHSQTESLADHDDSGDVDPINLAADKLAQELEAGYRIQSNHRLTRFLCGTQDGFVSEAQTQEFKRREALERTKFVIFRDSRIAKFIDSYYNNQQVPLKSTNHTSITQPGTPTPSQQRAVVSEQSFAMDHGFPPPPTTFLNHKPRSNASGISSLTMASTSLPTSGSGSHSTSSGPKGSDKAEVVTRDQLVEAFRCTWDKIEASDQRFAQLRDMVVNMKSVVAAIANVFESDHIIDRINELERQVAALRESRPLESDIALVAQLAGNLAELRKDFESTKNFSLNNDTLSRRSVQSEDELTKISLTNKLSLIEKYLGIDITTTGPKPHDVLEALHQRIWTLEQYLPQEEPACRIGKQYRTFNDLMKTTLDKNNSVVSYSATPGFAASTFGDNNSTYNGTHMAKEAIGRLSHLAAAPPPSALAFEGHSRFKYGRNAITNGASQGHHVLPAPSQVNRNADDFSTARLHVNSRINPTAKPFENPRPLPPPIPFTNKFAAVPTGPKMAIPSLSRGMTPAPISTYAQVGATGSPVGSRHVKPAHQEIPHSTSGSVVTTIDGNTKGFKKSGAFDSDAAHRAFVHMGPGAFSGKVLKGLGQTPSKDAGATVGS